MRATMDDGSVVPTVFSGNSLADQVGEVVDLMFDTNGGHVRWGADQESFEPVNVRVRAYYVVN